MLVRNRWLIVLAGALAILSAAFAACGDDGGDDDDATPTQGSTSSTVTTGGPDGEWQYVLTEAPDDAAPPEDQNITVNLRGEPESIDPQTSNFADNITIEHMIFAGLVTFDDDLNVVPLIATEVPSRDNGGISADGLTYTFKLRDDATWSDGEPVTANDFEFAIKRLFDPAVGVYYASFFTDIVGAEEVYGAVDASPDEIATLTAAIGVTAIDATTLEIKLARPVATFLQRMGLHAVLPVREDIVTANPEDWTEPGTIVTNGPYTLAEWNHGQNIVLEANPDFFLGEPVLQQITLIMQDDTNVALASYRAGELTTSQVPPAAVSDVRANQADELREGNTLVSFGLQFNNAEPPFDDPNVRKAFTAILDRDAYITAVRQGVGVPAISWVPPGIPGAQPEVGIEFDADAAREFLAASETYPDGQGLPAIRYTTAEDTTNQLIAEFVKSQASEILGVDIEIEILESAAFEEAYNTGDFQIAFSGWGADYPDIDNFLPAIFETGSSLNHFNYSNAEVDALFEQAANEIDNDERIRLYQQAQEIILVDDAGIAPLEFNGVFHLVKPNLRGFQLHPLDAQIPGDYSYARMYIAE